VFACKARSLQIAAAANLLAASWIVSLSVWRWAPSGVHMYGFAALDAALATTFFFMTRGRWFPVPLFFVHAALFVYDAYALMIGTGPVWVAAFINRVFEIALADVLACSLFRISKLAEQEKGAP
jgi:hypothetical protein